MKLHTQLRTHTAHICARVRAWLSAVGAWRGFVDGDYKRKRFCLRHAGWLVQAVVLALNEFVPITTGPRAGAEAFVVSKQF